MKLSLQVIAAAIAATTLAVPVEELFARSGGPLPPGGNKPPYHPPPQHQAHDRLPSPRLQQPAADASDGGLGAALNNAWDGVEARLNLGRTAAYGRLPSPRLQQPPHHAAADASDGGLGAALHKTWDDVQVRLDLTHPGPPLHGADPAAYGAHDRLPSPRLQQQPHHAAALAGWVEAAIDKAWYGVEAELHIGCTHGADPAAYGYKCAYSRPHPQQPQQPHHAAHNLGYAQPLQQSHHAHPPQPHQLRHAAGATSFPDRFVAGNAATAAAAAHSKTVVHNQAHLGYESHPQQPHHAASAQAHHAHPQQPQQQPHQVILKAVIREQQIEQLNKNALAAWSKAKTAHTTARDLAVKLHLEQYPHIRLIQEAEERCHNLANHAVLDIDKLRHSLSAAAISAKRAETDIKCYTRMLGRRGKK